MYKCYTRILTNSTDNLDSKPFDGSTQSINLPEHKFTVFACGLRVSKNQKIKKLNVYSFFSTVLSSGLGTEKKTAVFGNRQ